MIGCAISYGEGYVEYRAQVHGAKKTCIFIVNDFVRDIVRTPNDVIRFSDVDRGEFTLYAFLDDFKININNLNMPESVESIFTKHLYPQNKYHVRH